jgi:hypothetical protein
MKQKIISLIVLSLLTSPVSYADCVWNRDIKENQDGSYTYARDCHIQVGKNNKELDLRKQQVEELNKTIELKDLALTKQEERVNLWMDSTLKMNDKIQSYESLRSTNQILYFGLGVLVMSAAVWGAGQLR